MTKQANTTATTNTFTNKEGTTMNNEFKTEAACKAAITRNLKSGKLDATTEYVAYEMDNGSWAFEAIEGTKSSTDMATNLKRYSAGYVPSMNYNQDVTKTTGDNLADILRMRDPDEVIAIAESLLKIELAARYAKLNNGQRRMNAGNRIRAALKRNDITIEDVKAEVAAFNTEAA